MFLSEVLTTSRGWALIMLGSAIGFVFAIVALSISVVSFPLLLDRNVGVAVAIHTSVEAVQASPATMALWGLIVAGSLMIGFFCCWLASRSWYRSSRMRLGISTAGSCNKSLRIKKRTVLSRMRS